MKIVASDLIVTRVCCILIRTILKCSRGCLLMYCKTLWRCAYRDTRPGGWPCLMYAMPRKSAIFVCFSLPHVTNSLLSRYRIRGQKTKNRGTEDEVNATNLFNFRLFTSCAPKDFYNNLNRHLEFEFEVQQ